jgi:hypothetical protein
MKDYRVLIHPVTYQRSNEYLDRLKAGEEAGEYLNNKLRSRDLSQLSIAEFIELLIRTKRPTIFAESAILGNGLDWNQDELSLLGDFSITTPVTVYDNGRHRNPEVHPHPFAATLIFTPGALLRNGYNLTPTDWQAITRGGEIDAEEYYRLYERRLLPALVYIDRLARSKAKQAFITIPGLGCGQFAGKFHGKLGERLKNTLIRLIETHKEKISHVKAIYYDPYSECENYRAKIHDLDFLVRPLTKGNARNPQLCQPEHYAEIAGEFDNCELFSFVAWDHVSWPGNDFYAGARATDDGVKAAATSSMAVMTGIAGKYDPSIYHYAPPIGYSDWREVVAKNQIQLEVVNNLTILP